MLALTIWATGCGRSGDVHQEPVGTHTHEDGTTHEDHAEPVEAAGTHAHDETPIGTATIGDMKIEGAQGHGFVEPGKLCHLVVKLPYNDGGATIVRAWIGIDDRHLSLVGIADYAASHDDYDVHAEAPDPLPTNARWWIEIEKPDGMKSVGSLPILTAGS
jgi:hypothetical protein